MNIGIIVHSQTGNTYYVAQKLQEGLKKAGHIVSIERIEPIESLQVHNKDFSSIKLKSTPETAKFDAFIFASPVHAFTVSPVMASYLSKLKSLQNKNVICLVTQFFPFAWMGGNRAISHMKNICKSKDAQVIATAIINWTSNRREKKIAEMVKQCATTWFR